MLGTFPCWLDDAPAFVDLPRMGPSARAGRLACQQRSAAQVDLAALPGGVLLLAYNDQARDRGRLALATSTDAGAAWRRVAVLEDDPRGSFHYPTIQYLPDQACNRGHPACWAACPPSVALHVSRVPKGVCACAGPRACHLLGGHAAGQHGRKPVGWLPCIGGCGAWGPLPVGPALHEARQW